MILLLLLFCIFFKAHSQKLFSNLFNPNTNANVEKLLKFRNNYFGVLTSWHAGGGGAFIVAKFDSNGIVLKNQTESNFYEAYTALISNMGNIIVPAFWDSSTNFRYSIIIEFDTALNEKRRIVINDSAQFDSIGRYSLDIIQDKGMYYILGFEYFQIFNSTSGVTFINYKVSLTKLDSNFNLIWHKTLTPFQNWLFSKGFRIVPAGNNSFCIEIQQSSLDYDLDGYRLDVVNPVQAQAILMLVDSAGNILRSKTLTDSTNYFALGRGIVRTRDGGFVISGFTNTATDDRNSGTGYLLKVDSLLNPVWELTLGEKSTTAGLQTVLEDSIGNIIAVGQHQKIIYCLDSSLVNDSIIYSGWMIKTDPNGKLLWSRNIYNQKYEYFYYDNSAPISFISSLIAEPNGTFTGAGGTFTGFFGGNSWIFRTDTNGCTNATCDTALKNPIQPPLNVQNILTGTKQINIYPNPATNELIIESGKLKMESCILQLFDITGNLILQSVISGQQSVVSLEELQSGIYFLKINDANGAMVKTNKIAVMH